MDRNFGGVIWTNHALNRLRERGIKQGDAWATWNRAEQTRKGASGNWVYYKNWGGTQIEVVAKQNEKREWIILSVWSRPVFPGPPNSPKSLNPPTFSSFFKNLVKILFSK